MTNYCTIDRAKQAAKIEYKTLGFGDSDSYNNWLKDVIEGASRFIDNYCNRPENFFQPSGVSITEYHNGIGASPPSGMHEFSEAEESWEESSATIFTRQRPILSITTIKENKASIGEADNLQSITAYRWFKHGEIVFASSAIPAKGIKNIEIVYIIGYSQTPVDIQLACAQLVSNLIHKKLSDKTTAYTSFEKPAAINFGMPDIYTANVKTLLDHYKIAEFGEM